MRQDRGGNFKVVFDQLGFDNVVIGKKDFLEVREFKCALPNLGYLSCA